VPARVQKPEREKLPPLGLGFGNPSPRIFLTFIFCLFLQENMGYVAVIGYLAFGNLQQFEKNKKKLL